MKKGLNNLTQDELVFLELLSNQYPCREDAYAEIINLAAVLNLPKGTEHFVSDIHGEYEAFDHVMRNASGVIWEYIEELYGSGIRENEKKQLSLLVCYPHRMLEKARKEESDINDYYRVMLKRMVMVCKRAASKYTRSRVRKAMPMKFTHILEELIYENTYATYKQDYYSKIVEQIIALNCAGQIIQMIADLILRLAVDHLHVIGDIYDRGPASDRIMDDLCRYHSVDIQWGNHDINWMGAASGSAACICNTIRIAAKYNNLRTLVEGYGINLVPLATFAMEAYKNDPCERFALSVSESESMRAKDAMLIAKMHKAITIIQFKTEAEIIKRNPGFLMDDRLLLHKAADGRVEIDGKAYAMLDNSFPTVDFADPYALTPDEVNVIEILRRSFLNCDKLQEHVRFLFNKGSLYKIYNGNLLFHGGIPMNKDGTLKDVDYGGTPLNGRQLYDALDKACRQGYAQREREISNAKTRGLDVMWYLWCGADSPLYGKNKMATFERYFIAEDETHREDRDPYFDLRNSRDVCVAILENFGLSDEGSCIINGHVPVEIKKGESPIKADGKLLDIDGGFAKAYQKVTGLAGYTLTYNSRGMALTSHKPFTSAEDIVDCETVSFNPRKYINYNEKRILVTDTDIGRNIENKIESLTMLAQAYTEGLIKEI